MIRSHSQAVSFSSHISWFKLGHFPFNIHGITGGRLLDSTKMRVCTAIDTGASKPMVNKRTKTSMGKHHFYDHIQLIESIPSLLKLQITV